jgi:sec-independent protein translocase protein TatB
MFEVGFTEIVLILVLGLFVLGPKNLPGFVNKVGRWTGRARSMARQLRMQLEHEVSLEELAKSRPMQGGPPPQSDQQPSPEATRYDAAPDMIADAPAEVAAASEVASAHSAQPVDLSKPLQ